MHLRGIATAIAVLICVSACSSGSDPSSPEKPKDVVTTIDPKQAEVLKLGNDLEIVAELPRTLGEQETFFQGFTSDGKILGGVSLPETTTGGQMGRVESQSHPVLYDPETNKFTILDSRNRTKPTQMPSIVSSGDFVVWAETPDATIGSSTIAIYSYDRRSKRVAQLFSASDPHGIMVGGDDVVVVGDEVYFSRWACCREKDRGNASVYSVPVDGSAPAKVLVKGGQFVSLAGGSLTYEVKGVKFSRDLRTGETTPIPTSPQAEDPGFCGAEFTESFETLCMGTPSENDTVADAKLSIKETSGRTTMFKPFPSDSLNNATPHRVEAIGPWTGVTMTSDGGADRLFLVDLETHVMKAFPDDTAFWEMNHDGTQALLSKTGDVKRWPQVIVRIPPKS
jgi:hypothetical protein